MNKKVTTIRLNEYTLTRLSQLVRFEIEDAEKHNYQPRSRNQIIEDAIDNYYAIKLDKDNCSD